LAAEHKYELEAAKEAGSEVPEFLESLRSQGTWDIQDTPGSDTVKLVRKFGNET
jgi:complement component 1 Q subcomponent-binding protein